MQAETLVFHHEPVGPEREFTSEADETTEPAIENATEIIARVFARDFERVLLAESALVFADDQAEWSETAAGAQAESLPEH
jgi:hypothetical protein